MCTDFDFNWIDFDILENFSYPEIDMDGILKDIQNSHPAKPMAQWTTEEVMEFIVLETPIRRDDSSYDCHLERFGSISGYIFTTLSEEDCKLLANSNYLGEIIYKAKEKYLRCHPVEYNFEEIKHYFRENGVSNEEDFDEKQSKRPGRPRCKPPASKIGKRSERLWEFLLHLLSDSKTCPQLIKWENFEEGTFKFVQNDKVARLWGNRKKNENMTYEKFSRAMRYYYKSEVLLPVPGKRLVYKFGPQAKGWKSITPIS